MKGIEIVVSTLKNKEVNILIRSKCAEFLVWSLHFKDDATREVIENELEKYFPYLQGLSMSVTLEGTDSTSQSFLDFIHQLDLLEQ